MLRSAQAAELPAITQEKITLVEQLNQLGAERRALLPKTQASDDAAAMTEWLMSNSSNTDAAQTWRGILELAREARQMHERNGKLVSILLQKPFEIVIIEITLHNQSAIKGTFSIIFSGGLRRPAS